MTKLNSIRLFLPEPAMTQRVGDAQPLAEYVKALVRETETFWAAAEPPGAKGVFVAVGVRPDGKSRAWCDAVEGDIPAATLQKFQAALEKVNPVPVKGGPIAFAMELGLRGQMPAKFPVMPKAWTDAAKASKQPLLVPDGLFKVIWPE